MARRRGVRLALDWGTARIGVAACDPDGLLAFPLATVAAGNRELATLVELVAEQAPLEVVVGLPLRLAGNEGPAAAAVRSRAAALRSELDRHGLHVPLRLVDERLSTVTASRRLRESGRNARQQRGVIDAAAAVAILESALAAEDVTDQLPGVVLSTAVPAVPPGPSTAADQEVPPS